MTDDARKPPGINSTRANALRELIDMISDTFEDAEEIAGYEIIPDIDTTPDWDLDDNIEIVIKVDVASESYCHDSFTIKVQ